MCVTHKREGLALASVAPTPIMIWILQYLMYQSFQIISPKYLVSVTWDSKRGHTCSAIPALTAPVHNYCVGAKIVSWCSAVFGIEKSFSIFSVHIEVVGFAVDIEK